MSASLAILTIGIVPMQEVLPLLTEYIDEDNISHHSLLGKLSREEVMAEYAPEAGEDTILTLLNDNQLERYICGDRKSPTSHCRTISLSAARRNLPRRAAYE